MGGLKGPYVHTALVCESNETKQKKGNEKDRTFSSEREREGERRDTSHSFGFKLLLYIPIKGMSEKKKGKRKKKKPNDNEQGKTGKDKKSWTQKRENKRDIFKRMWYLGVVFLFFFQMGGKTSKKKDFLRLFANVLSHTNAVGLVENVGIRSVSRRSHRVRKQSIDRQKGRQMMMMQRGSGCGLRG